MDGAKASKAPMSTTTKFGMDESGKLVNKKYYKGMISSLLYLIASRPDIIFATCLCARFQSSNKESHILSKRSLST